MYSAFMLPAPTPRRPEELFRLFVGVALAGIGGGLPAHARRRLTGRGWLSELEFAESFTLAQLTPGPNAVNLAAMVGARLAGGAGALAAVLGVLFPGLLAMLAASALTLGLPGGLPPTLQSALYGAACAALSVMLTAVLPVLRVGLSVRGGPGLAALAFALLWRTKINAALVVLGAAVAGALLEL